MDLAFGLSPDNKRRTGIEVFVDRSGKMVHLAAVPAEVTAKQTARLFLDIMFRHHDMPIAIVSDRYPVPKPNKHADMTKISAVSTRARTAGSPFNASTVSTPGADTLNTNEQHIQTGPVVNKALDPNKEFSSKAMAFVQRRQIAIRFGQGATAATVDRQKLYADKNGRGNTNGFKVGSLVLLVTHNLARHAVSDLIASKLAPRFVGPFTRLAKDTTTYILDILPSVHPNPTFKMVPLTAVRKSATAPQAAQRFVDNVFRHHGLPKGLTPFYVNELLHSHTPLSLPPASNSNAGEAGADMLETSNT
ncbi:unnamed protein product [Phytophthora fragariaefolia]|uniref:Unnamed protein product n=1 Tax=Phytophthora fragariaefolia TaxID=1490495 RepID=A0A9W6TXF1_9STRA|nr:unnamed protein product [Phytophthora fragariaefolia]